MDEDIKKEIQDQRKLLEQIFASVEKTRKYFLWTMIGSIVVFVLPLIVFLFVLPSFLGTITGGGF